MTFNDIKDYFGTIAAAAEKIGVNRQTVYEWEEHGVPEGRQYQLEIITNGGLRAELPADRTNLLRPAQESQPAP